MKKKIVYLLVALLLLAMILTACNQVTPTEIVTRWGNEESFTFSISKADYAPEGSPTAFNPYKNGDTTHYRDFVIQTPSARETVAREEISPENVSGTYTLTLKRDGAYNTLSTSQLIYAQYKTSQITEIAADLQENGLIATADEDPFEKNAELTTLKSITNTYVKFSNQTTQRPVDSAIEVKGFYIGLKAKTVSKYTLTTAYNFDRNVAIVSKNNETPIENKLNVNSNSKFIDSNQLIIYARSLEKNAAFQDNPTVIVYNAQNNKNYTATFGLSLNQNAVVNKNGKDEYVKLHTLGIGLDDKAFMLQEILPKLSNIDTTPNPADATKPYSKYSMVRFRVGYLAYEVQDFYSDELIAALQAIGTDKK